MSSREREELEKLTCLPASFVSFAYFLLGDASFSHVKESNEDNVFVLNFSSSEEKHFVSLWPGCLEGKSKERKER